MENNPITIFLAVVTGCGIGLVSAVFMQQHVNRQAVKECSEVHHRRLISLSSVVGDTYYCLPAYYFNK